MKTDYKPIALSESGYIDLSEKLRCELESKIDKLCTQNHFNQYVSNQGVRFENATKSDLLCSYLLSKAPNEYVLSGELLQGIKTWFNMYYDDRLSVIDRFRSCYQNAIQLENIIEKPVLTIAFCRFLISELLCILAESRWQDLVHHAANYGQILYN